MIKNPISYDILKNLIPKVRSDFNTPLNISCLEKELEKSKRNLDYDLFGNTYKCGIKFADFPEIPINNPIDTLYGMEHQAIFVPQLDDAKYCMKLIQTQHRCNVLVAELDYRNTFMEHMIQTYGKQSVRQLVDLMKSPRMSYLIVIRGLVNLFKEDLEYFNLLTEISTQNLKICVLASDETVMEQLTQEPATFQKNYSFALSKHANAV